VFSSNTNRFKDGGLFTNGIMGEKYLLNPKWIQRHYKQQKIVTPPSPHLNGQCNLASGRRESNHAQTPFVIRYRFFPTDLKMAGCLQMALWEKNI
jgi:hypothetical protein